MRILWVKVGGLFPVNTGGRRRSFETIAELSRRHQVLLATTHAPGEDPQLLRDALPDCEQVISVPHQIPKRGSAAFIAALARSWLTSLPVDIWRCRVAALREQVRVLMIERSFDICVADFLVAVPNVQGLWNGSGPPVVLFEHNVENQIWRRMRDNEERPLHRKLLAHECTKLEQYEAQACAWAQRTVAVSDADGAQLKKLAPQADVSAIPTGVDTTYFSPQEIEPTPHSLVFTGAMDWFPNEDGILHFCETTLPLIRRAIPDVTLTVVGRNPTAKLRSAIERDGIKITGTVDDVRPYLAKGAVCIVPLRIGGGTRLKIFEALAMGKAVVTSTIGAEGLPVISGNHLQIADEPAQFASAVVELLNNPLKRRALGSAGRRLVEWQFAWPQVARHFEQHLTEVTSHAR